MPNALLGELLKFFKEGNHLLETVYQLVIVIQSFMAFIIGVLAAHQFKFKGAGAAIIGTSAMLGSGVVHFSNKGIELKGIGDIINVIVVVALACFIYMFLEGKLGSFEMIILPVLVPVISGVIGLLTFAVCTSDYSINWKSCEWIYRVKSFVNVYTNMCNFFFINGYTNFTSGYRYSN